MDNQKVLFYFLIVFLALLFITTFTNIYNNKVNEINEGFQVSDSNDRRDFNILHSHDNPDLFLLWNLNKQEFINSKVGEQSISINSLALNGVLEIYTTNPFRHTVKIYKEGNSDVIAYDIPTFVQFLTPGDYTLQCGIHGNMEVTLTVEENATTASGDVTTPSSDVTTPSGDVTTASGDVTTPSSDVTTPSGDVTTASGDVTTASGNVTTATGGVTTASGDVTTASYGSDYNESLYNNGSYKNNNNPVTKVINWHGDKNQYSQTIKVGDTIRWNVSRSHTVTSGRHDAPESEKGTEFDKNFIENGGTFDHQFSRPGRFHYHCREHSRSMRGTITVIETRGEVTTSSTTTSRNNNIPVTKTINWHGNPNNYSQTIIAGDAIRWNVSKDHTVTSGRHDSPEALKGKEFDGNFIQEAGIFVHKFNRPGTYDYHCRKHSTTMRGTIRVLEKTITDPQVLSRFSREYIDARLQGDTEEALSRIRDAEQRLGTIDNKVDTVNKFEDVLQRYDDFHKDYHNKLENILEKRFDTDTNKYDVKNKINQKRLEKIKEDLDLLETVKRNTEDAESEVEENKMYSLRSMADGSRLNIHYLDKDEKRIIISVNEGFLQFARNSDGDELTINMSLFSENSRTGFDTNQNLHFIVRQISNREQYNNEIELFNDGTKLLVEEGEQISYPFKIITPILYTGFCLSLENGIIKVVPCANAVSQRFQISNSPVLGGCPKK